MSKYVKDSEWGKKYPNFEKSEFKCPCCGGYGNGIATTLLDTLQALRNKYGRLVVTSGYRCSKHNKKVGGVSNSKHLSGMAADFYFASGILASQSKRVSVVNEIKKMNNVNYSYCNVNGNYPNMGSAIHVDTKLVDTDTKSIDEIAKEVIDGKWGNGTDRKKRLTEAGYNYSEVQARVNELVKTPAKKYIQIIARDGVWCRTNGYGFKYPKYKVIPYKTKCELLSKNVGTANNYYWDKIKYEGKIVYIPNQWNKYL